MKPLISISPLTPKIELLVSSNVSLQDSQHAFNLNEVEDTEEYTNYSRSHVITYNGKSAPARLVHTVYKDDYTIESDFGTIERGGEGLALEGGEDFFNTFRPHERQQICNQLCVLMEVEPEEAISI